MDLRDFIVTPFVIMVVYAVAYWLRPKLTDEKIRGYYFPALSVKILGALALGLIYQFYYDGGDTYNYHTHGSRVIWESLWENPSAALRMIFAPPPFPELYKYSSRVEFYTDPSSMVVVRLAALVDLLTFSVYSSTAVIFAFFSFIGMWLFFLTFYELFPHLRSRLAICAMFIPSVVFWGSGILKDTIVMACLGAATYALKKTLIDKQVKVRRVVMLLVSLILIYEVKKYVLLCYLPAAFFWVYASNLLQIRSMAVRIILVPFVVSIAVVSGFFAVQKVGEDDPRYAIDKIAQTAQVTAYDIRYYTGKDAGSGYSLGELDGSFGSMISLFPQAVNVSLFRPYIWEAKNPLMILSALEAGAMLLITLVLLFRAPIRFFQSMTNPTVIFCLIFSITFAFAVGVSTFNFGTLTRYRIPLLPFYVLALVVMADSGKSERKLDELEETE